jgi:hypothetical protein
MAGPECPIILDNGGYNVQPPPNPPSLNAEQNNKAIEIGRTQNLTLFKRGKPISGRLSIIGTNQFPNPPIIIGITRKKIMISP